MLTASSVQAQVILCDAAVADPSGKIHMLGAGWSVTGTPTTPSAVALLLKIPWDLANRKLPLKLELLDGDGHPMSLATPAGQQGVGAEAEIETGRPPGMPPGSMLDASFALNIGPLPLPPGGYEWRLEFAESVFSAFFRVVQPSDQPAGP